MTDAAARAEDPADAGRAEAVAAPAEEVVR